MLRTHTNGELSTSEIGKEVILSGWVHTRRDHGGVIFIDLRDRYGFTQIVFNPESKCFKEANKLRREDVIKVKGKVRARPKGMENPNISTGKIEVLVDELEILNKADVPPIEIDDRIVAGEDLRLKYRYLDLRRPIMQKRLLFRHKAAQIVRNYLSKENFIEVETPMLIASTPEGARDYVVPSRIHPGKFYALPQSPQIYKQMLMVAGCDRYFQLARCLRDEDLRADRQPEHTQIDIEMCFVEQQDVLDLVEGLYKHLFKEMLGITLPKFPVLTYDEAMERFGCDKPDLRFGLELVDVTEIAKKSDFNVFKQAEMIKCLPCPHEFSRGDLDKLVEWAKNEGSKGLAWMKITGNSLEGSISKFFKEEIQKQLIKKAGIKSGVLFFIADKKDKANEMLARLRNKLGKDLNLIKENDFKFCWVVDFPMFEWNADEQKWDFKHNPFAMPKKRDLDILEKEPGKVYAELYDLVLNGIELGSGAIRITRPDIQERVFKITGMDMETARKRFGFMIDAYKYGGPPHGGIGLGFDRTVALMQGLNDIREVIAFPKSKAAECPMDGSPSEIEEKQLKELHIKIDVKKQ